MTHRKLPVDEMVLQWLADRATGDIDPQDELALKSWLAAHPEVDAEGLDLAAAAMDVAWMSEHHTESDMPKDLASRLEADAAAFFKRDAGDTPRSAVIATINAEVARPAATATSSSLVAWSGWLAAAAAIAIAAASWWPTGSQSPASPDTSRQQLLSKASDVVTVPWAAPEDPRFAGVTGDVVWSNTLQQGYMRLKGMPANDPARRQYQLWIVDPAVDQHPVDGGVFDVSTSGEVIIPIDAKLSVTRPAAFAITEERPGGVVVSAGPLLVVASVEG